MLVARSARFRLDHRLSRPGKTLFTCIHAWQERRSEMEYSTREKMFSIAPAIVQTKDRLGPRLV
jgi:hypothetical protein